MIDWVIPQPTMPTSLAMFQVWGRDWKIHEYHLGMPWNLSVGSSFSCPQLSSFIRVHKNRPVYRIGCQICRQVCRFANDHQPIVTMLG